MMKTVEKTEQIEYHGVPATRVTYRTTYVVDDGTPESSKSYDSSVTYVDECRYCEDQKAEESTFFPSHFASARCQSGQHSHCTCDTCF